MNSGMKKKSPFLVLARILILAILIVAVIHSGRFANFMDIYSLVFVIIGGVALILMSFTAREIAAATRSAGKAIGSHPENHKSLTFWESSSRSFWMVGVLATLISFVIALTNSEGGVEGIATRMASALIPTVYGVILSVICFVPVLKLKEARTLSLPKEITEENEKTQDRITAPLSFENIIGYVLIIAIIIGTFIKAAISSKTPIFDAWEWMIYWPSFLVVLGGTIALVLFVGNSAKGQTFTLGFAVTGLIGSLMGIIQVLLGFSSRSIQDIAAAVTFILSSCFFSLIGMMLVGAPLEDRSIKDLKTAKRSTLSRVAWYVFPLVTLILLVITFVIVVTPIKKQFGN
ncbi:MAG: MotA/TolQ/ExbB proton channel family protein [Candidatus Aminicenantes bacterium]|nr:MotA/TolQ/ExbB proton channel family protein [Candidatus Aminicenantes bacterium]MDH5384222.1 MotA/TolQ/ExbB proton channel family protein [Candidatus Aminicenantes bacterium]